MLAHLGLPLVLLATSTRAAQHILLAAAQGGELTSLVFDDAARTLAKGNGLANAGGQATAISPDAKWAIVVGAGTAQAGSVAAYSIAANGVIAESGKSVGSGGINAVSVAFSNDGSTVAVANLNSSTITGFSFSNGQLSQTPVSTQKFDADALPSDIAYDPSGQYVFVPLRSKGITAELSSQPNGQLAAGTTLALPAQLAKAEPISTTFAVAGKTRMFSLLAATSTITVWSMCIEGTSMSLNSLQELGTKNPAAAPAINLNSTTPVPVPVAASGPGACAQAVSPNGDLLVVTNCGVGGTSDTAALFKIDGTGSAPPLSQLGIFPLTGTNPRSVSFASTGTFIAVALQGTSAVAVYSVTTTGLTEVARLAPLPNVAAVKFVAPLKVPNLSGTCDKASGNLGTTGGAPLGPDGQPLSSALTLVRSSLFSLSLGLVASLYFSV